MLFTERNGMRVPIEQTYNIDIERYSLLFDCCARYHDNLAYKFPEYCLDGYGICGVDEEQFITNLMFDIPTLFNVSERIIDKPQKKSWSDEVPAYDQYALLDLIEYYAHYIRDIVSKNWHSYYRHYELSFRQEKQSDEEIFIKFKSEINSIFEKTGLLYKLTDEKIIERIINNEVLTSSVFEEIEDIDEPGLKELLKEAIKLHKNPKPLQNHYAVEKIWDAFERLKTYNIGQDKKTSLDKIIRKVSNNETNYGTLFDKEFRALTDIGNDFRIRHHETNKIEIIDEKYYDYLFNRCLSLISLVILYLDKDMSAER